MTQPQLRLSTLLRSCVVAFAFALVAFLMGSARPAAAATAAGTAITNTATATYSDGTNNYTSQSNTVTTTVQNAPALTIAPPQSTPGSNTVSPGASITDTYTLTNTGNASGFFQLTGAQGTADGVTAGSGTFTQYIVNVPGQTQQTFTTIAAVNSYLSTGNTGGTPFTVPQVSGTPTSANQITIGVTYSANAGATGTITTNLTAAITQPAAGSAPAATSASVIGQYNDNVVTDARMDLQKLATVGGTATAPTVTYTVRANNGGGRAMVAVNRSGLPAGAGITGAGIVVTDKLPQFPSGTQLTLNGTPTFVTQPAGATFIYSTDGVNFTTTATGAVYVGVFIPSSAITGSFGASNPGSSQNTVSAAQAQLAFSFTINGSTASGSANANAITNVVNSIYGDQSGFIEGPGITFQSVPNTSSATASQTAPAIANTNGTLTGSAQITSAASPATASVLNGPNGFPAATGQTSTNDDYTAVSYTNGGTILAATNGASEAVPASAAAVTVTNSAQNGGNKDDTFSLTTGTLAADLAGNALPTGWTVTFKSTGQTASGSCPAVTAGTAITSICVTSGSTATYQVVMTPPASATTFTTYAPYGVAITATSTNDNTKTNITNDEFFVGGFVKMTKSVAVDSGVPCSTAATFTVSTTVNPGDCVQYTVVYLNVAPTGGTNDLTLNASTIVITEDGTASGTTDGVAYANNWAANTSGLFATPVDSTGGTLAGFNPGPAAAGSSKFTDTVASLAAGASGNVIFKVQIK